MTSDVEHIFMYLLVFIYLPWKISFQAFCPFFNWVICFVFVYLLLSYMNSLYILDINPLLDIWFANVFPFCKFLFTLLMFFSAVQNLFSWM